MLLKTTFDEESDTDKKLSKLATSVINVAGAATLSVDSGGTLSDGGGLMLLVNERGAKTWIWRYVMGSRRRDLTLGRVVGVLPLVLQWLQPCIEDARGSGMVPLPQLVAKVAAQGNEGVENPCIAQRPGREDSEQCQRANPVPVT